jgi:hypothetical protein
VYEDNLLAARFAALAPESLAGDWGDVLGRAGAAPKRARRLGWFLPRAPRLRLALAMLVLLLLLAGIATATYLGARLVYETPRTMRLPGEDQWSNFVLGPGGDDFYAIRVPLASPGQGEGSTQPLPHVPQLMRIDGVKSGGQLHPTPVLDYAALAAPGFAVQYGSIASGRLAAAANGDLFFAVTSGPRDTLLVLRRDGSRQRIVDGSELLASDLFPAAGGVTFKIAASAPDRVWLWTDPWEGDQPQRLFEAIDPNADGDWSDRVLRPIGLPDSLPFAKGLQRTSWNAFPNWRWQLTAEQSLPGDDRSHSVLAAALSHDTGEFRIYRISDRNDDGDALDAGEARLIFDRPHGVPGGYPLDLSGVPPMIAPLIVRSQGMAHREIAVAGLASRDRVSLISDSGAVREIGPAFPNSIEWPANGLSVVAGAHGDIYAIVATQTQDGLGWTVFRLDSEK